MNIGEPFSWKPAAYGHVVYINEAHRYFTAEADINGNKLRESFKF